VERSGVPPTQTEHGRAAPVDERRERFGGFNFGAAFFGWLVAVAITVLLSAVAAAIGGGIGSAVSSGPGALQNAGGIALAGGIVLLVILAIAYFAGGYVAGRMSRFDGGRQGLGVWLIGLIISIILALVGTIAGAGYDVLSKLNLSAVPTSPSTLGIGGLIGVVIILAGTLLAAIGGGKAGERYHRRVDRFGPSVP
jgi:hypothetical protein